MKEERDLSKQRFDNGRTRLLAGVVPVRINALKDLAGLVQIVESSPVLSRTQHASSNKVWRRTVLESLEVLMITSSKKPSQWILPKGGWELHEAVEQCAHREAMEEAGAFGDIIESVGPIEYTSGQGSCCRMHGFLMYVRSVNDTKSEKFRQKQWVSLENALELVANRNELHTLLSLAIDKLSAYRSPSYRAVLSAAQDQQR